MMTMTVFKFTEANREVMMHVCTSII